MKETILIVAAVGLLAAFMATGSQGRSIFYEMAAGATDAVLTAAGEKVTELSNQASEAWHGEWGDEWDWMENQPGW